MFEIIIPALLVGLAGGVIGLVLAVVAKAFEVHIDQLALDITAALPGLNCGACGYMGCGDYAKALSSGEEEAVNLCTPGRQPVLIALEEIMKAA